jgi:hypothetical protein
MKIPAKKWIFLILAIVLLFGGARLYYRLTDDIRLSNMTYSFPLQHDPSWEIPKLTSQQQEDLKEIIQQKFYYIGKGAQSYVFESANGLYVLKFFKFKHLKPNLFIEWLPSIPPFAEFKQNSINRKNRKLNDIFRGYALAFNETRESSGLVYVHLVPTSDLHLEASVFDKIGRPLQINLDDFVFIIQKKGVTLGDRLKELLEKGRLLDAQRMITKILEMYLSDYKKGIYDKDHGVMHNTGFIGEEPFHLDVGKIDKDERMKQLLFYKTDFQEVAGKIEYWSRRAFPRYSPEIADFLSQEYLKYIGEPVDFKTIDAKHYQRK